MARLSPADRQALARRAARELLASGVTADALTLRMVAQRADMPLPTLTYVYGRVGELLADLQFEFESQVAATQSNVGTGGLAKELEKMLRAYLMIMHNDPANIEILRWQFQQVGRGEIRIPGGLTMVGCLNRIQERSGEQWRLSVDDLSTLAQSMISGMHMQFFVRGADRPALEAWWRESRMIVEALDRLAQPGPEPTDSRRVRLPARVSRG
jgi:AcrR family transcriptional regulator